MSLFRIIVLIAFMITIWLSTCTSVQVISIDPRLSATDLHRIAACQGRGVLIFKISKDKAAIIHN